MFMPRAQPDPVLPELRAAGSSRSSSPSAAPRSAGTARAATRATAAGSTTCRRWRSSTAARSSARPTRPPWERAQRLHRAERLRARHPARRDRELRLQPERRRAAQPVGRGRGRRAALLRAAAAALGRPEVPAPAARPGAVRARAQGPRGHARRLLHKGFSAPCRGYQECMFERFKRNDRRRPRRRSPRSRRDGGRQATTARPRHTTTGRFVRDGTAATGVDRPRGARATCARASARSSAASTGAPPSSAGSWRSAWR